MILRHRPRKTVVNQVKFISTVSVVTIQQKADELAKEYREIDTHIQQADCLTTLLE